MIAVRKAADRGRAQHGWLESYHTFSFADYYDEHFMGFRQLRVINEDRVQPGEGFGTHSHRDMEIITCVLEGALAHKDSMGTSSVIHPGEVQRMSAGRGVSHSEFNHSRTELVHFLQIWIMPAQNGIQPSYEQRAFPDSARLDQLRLVGSRDGRNGSLTIHQDIDLYATSLTAGAKVSHRLAANRHAWIQVTHGAVSLGDVSLAAGDGAAVSDETALVITATAAAELLLFDLA
jgi:quercetin 2,3-dioxygenase